MTSKSNLQFATAQESERLKNILVMLVMKNFALSVVCGTQTCIVDCQANECLETITKTVTPTSTNSTNTNGSSGSSNSGGTSGTTVKETTWTSSVRTRKIMKNRERYDNTTATSMFPSFGVGAITLALEPTVATSKYVFLQKKFTESKSIFILSNSSCLILKL